MNSRISSLAPVLNSPSLSGTVSVNPDLLSAPIDILVKNHSGSTYIFTVAMRNNAVTGLFVMNGLSGTTQIDVLDENRSITATNGIFQDSFDAYGVHLYKVNSLSGIHDKLSTGMNEHRRSLRLISVMQDGAGFISAHVQNGASVTVYTIQGKLLNTVSETNAGSLKVPEGVYIVQTK